MTKARSFKLFKFFRRNRPSPIQSLMDHTKDLMLCLQFNDPIDIHLRGAEIDEALRKAVVADISLTLARVLGFQNRDKIIGSSIMDLVEGTAPAWFVNFGSDVISTNFKNEERLISIPHPDGNSRFIRMYMQNIIEDDRLHMQWITMKNVNKEVYLERQAKKDEQTKIMSLDAASLYTFEASLSDGRLQIDTAGLNKAALNLTKDTIDKIDEFTKLILPGDLKQIIPNLTRYRSGKLDHLHLKFRLNGKHGGTRWIEVWGSPTERNETGGVVTTTGIYRDITDEVEFSQKLISTQKLESLGVLAGGIAHDFNNLLTTIIGYAELGQIPNQADKTPEELFERIRKSAFHAADLCSQLLAYAGVGSLKYEKVLLGDFLADNLDLLKVSASKRVNIQLKSDAQTWVWADASQLRQVIMNLVSNSSDALNNKSGELVIQVVKRNCDATTLLEFIGDDMLPGEYASLMVSDNGSGMDTDTLARMFDPFFTTKLVGRGLGMAVVVGVIRSHGGCLRVESAPDMGTSIEILFPVIPTPLPIDKTLKESTAPLTHRKVLVVDDEEDVCEIVTKMLRRLGVECVTASSGDQVMNLLADEIDSLSLILLDITMPEVDGITLAYKILDTYPNLPITLYSGYTDHAIPADMRDRVSFLKKPFSLGKLRDAVRDTSISP
ncbi:MAG: signal transduction histidine kinase/CheY-like chemotaxis protein [Candidatus Azotimanducaceae bacterium]|jgi:signal transduction histidine kinase/CheY-like chemotaxis protein